MRSATVSAVLLLALALLVTAVPAAQEAQEAQEAPVGPVYTEPEFGEVYVLPLFHASVLLQYGDTVIQVDPTSRVDYYDFPDADIVLITDTHGDHFDRDAATMLMALGAKVVAPPAVADEWGGVDLVLENGFGEMVDDVYIQAIPAYNIEHGPAKDVVYHPMGRGNGYVITLGGKRIYISGDTECIEDVQTLENIDIAFMCMNLPFTMSPGEAAECVKKFKPKIVYPYHYRGSDLDVFKWQLEDTPEVEVRILDWYPPSSRLPRPQ
jgi:L-ascorbate metabolism protein UlaG (beta-lactamase superfamily)